MCLLYGVAMKEQRETKTKYIVVLAVITLVNIVLVWYSLSVSAQTTADIKEIKQVVNNMNTSVEKLKYQQDVDSKLWDAQQKLNQSLAQWSDRFWRCKATLNLSFFRFSELQTFYYIYFFQLTQFNRLVALDRG